MAAATLLYNGSATDAAAIITAVGTNAAANLLAIPNANGLGVTIFLQGS